MSDAPLTADDWRTWSLTVLEPVWVPFTDAEKKEREGKPQRGRVSEGPNDEPADSGKWRLRWPRGHKKAGEIFDGEMLSVSALDTASECLSKWGYPKVFDYVEPENRKAALGNLRHDELERWEKYGTAPTTPGMAAVLIHFPAPGAESECFFGFAIEREGKTPIVIAGFLDVRESAVDEESVAARSEPDGYVGEGGDSRNKPEQMNSVVYDLKTTGDFRWKKTPAQLRANIQAAAYALGEMLRVEAVRGKGANGTDLVLLRWVYAQQKELTDKNATPLEEAECEITRVELADDDSSGVGGVWISREEAFAVVAQYVPLAETLLDIMARSKAERAEYAAKADAPGAFKSAMVLPKNSDACWSYGGCPWKKIDVSYEWEEMTKVSKLVFEGGREKIVQIEKKEKKQRTEKVCTPPFAEPGATGTAGFMAMHKQQQAKAAAKTSAETGEAVAPIGGKDGIEKAVEAWNAASKEDRELIDRALGGIKDGPKHETRTQVVTEKPKTNVSATSAGAKKMGLMNRFSGAVAAAPTAAPVETPKAAPVAAPVEAPKEVPVPVNQTAGTATSGGLMGRFAGAAAKAPEKAVDVKAATDGMASSAGAAGGGAPAGETLAQRLTRIKNSASVATAVANAPTNSVATGALAVGINPADAAPEMSQAEQIAEGERLAAAGKSAESGETIAEGAAAAGAAAKQVTAGEAPKRGRGRPAGSTNKSTQELGDIAKAAGEGNVIPVLDLLVQGLMSNGMRREAAVLLKASADIEALSATPAVAAA